MSRIRLLFYLSVYYWHWSYFGKPGWLIDWLVQRRRGFFRQAMQISDKIPTGNWLQISDRMLNFVPKFFPNGIFSLKLCIFWQNFFHKKEIFRQFFDSPKFSPPPFSLSPCHHATESKLHSCVALLMFVVAVRSRVLGSWSLLTCGSMTGSVRDGRAMLVTAPCRLPAARRL